MPPDAVLLDQFLAYLERRREKAQRWFDELRRLKLAAAMTRGLLRPPLSDSQGTRLDRAEPRQSAYS